MEELSLREQLRMVFNQIDKDQSGTLSISEIEDGLKMLNLGYNIESHSLAQEIWTECSRDQNVTYEAFLEWNIKKISLRLAHSQANTMASLFISPAFRVVNLLKSFDKYIPEDHKRELQWCIEQISSGELYSTRQLPQLTRSASLIEQDSFQIINFFSKFEKENQLEIDEDFCIRKSRDRSNSSPGIIYKRSSTLPNVDIDIEDPKFNIFALCSTLEENRATTCRFIADKVFEKWHLFKLLSINRKTFLKFTHEISHGYKPLPYHSALHAADVMQCCNLFLTKGGIVVSARLEAIHIAGLLLSALIHDVKHPGVTNGFLESTSDALAIQYNDKSVLENFHLAEAFKTAMKDDCNIFAGLAKEEYRILRHMVIQCVLKTDMSTHADQLGSIQTRLTLEMLPNNKQLLLESLLHAADISHSLREWDIHEKWSAMIQDEFFTQGDIEKSMGREIISLFDRNKASVPRLQLGYINAVILPYFTPLLNLMPELKEMQDNIEKNRDKWASEI